MTKTPVLAALLLAAGLTLTACGTEDTSAGSGSASGSASAEFNDADVEFAQSMIPHHQQAVEMAQLAEDRASSPEVKQLAADIEAAQGPEIETMTAWLEEWGEEVPASGGGHGDMEGMEDMDDTSDMPGMMSEDEMGDLESAEGDEWDEMFLTMMIEHHEGAIEMARTEQSEGQNPDAVALAEKIEADQTAEIETMEGLLGS